MPALEFSGYETSKVLDDQHRLLINNDSGKIRSLDLETLQPSWEKKFDSVYDVRILHNPSKLIVLAKDQGKLMKFTLSVEGNILSQQEIANPSVRTWMKQTESLQISWSPSTAVSKERLAIYSSGSVFIYEYPWKTTPLKIDVNVAPNSSYEDVLTQEIQLEWPYLVVKHQGGALMQVQDFYTVYHAVTKKKVDILMDQNTSSDFTMEQGALVVNSSSITPGPGGTRSAPGNLIYGRYDLATGKSIYEKRAVFHNNETKWSTKYDHQQLLLLDSDTNTLAQFDQRGRGLSSVNIEKAWSYSGILWFYQQNFILTKRSEAGITLDRIPVNTDIIVT
jgi:hypothetical protein